MIRGETCSIKDAPDYRKLATIIGDDIETERLFQQNSNQDDPVQASLDRFNIEKYTIADKENDLRLNSSNLFLDTATLPDGTKDHTYRISKGANQGQTYKSMSEKLDEDPELKFRSDKEGSIYSEIGTVFHDIADIYNKGQNDAASIANIEKLMIDENIPEGYFSQIKQVFNKIKGGKILTEVTIADHALGIAGTVDILHLRDDGKVDIYDFKTSHGTPTILEYVDKYGGDIWNPKNHYDGYKVKRYPAQLEGYSRIIEKILQQPVNNKYIIPIEIEYNTPENPLEEGFKSVKILPFESISEYGEVSDRNSKDTVNDIFNQRPETRNYNLDHVSPISDLIGSISGQLTEHKGAINAQTYAKDLLKRKGFLNYDGSAFTFNNKDWIPFKHGSSDAAKIAQVADAYTRTKSTGNKIIRSIKNFMETGSNDYISSNLKGANIIEQFLEHYYKLYGGSPESFANSGLEIFSLEMLPGFSGYSDWIVFKKDNVVDLFYFGEDNLNAKIFPTGADSQDTLFAATHTKSEATFELGSELKNNYGDLRKFQATLIGMKLAKDLKIRNEEGDFIDANIKLDTIVIASSETNSKPRPVDLSEMLPIIEKVVRSNRFKDLVDDSLKPLFADDVNFKPETYQQDYFTSYVKLLEYTDSYKTAPKDFRASIEKYAEDIQDVTKRIRAKNEFIPYVQDRINKLVSKDAIDATGISTNKQELEMLSAMLFQLEGMPVSMKAITSKTGKFFIDSNLAKMPQNIESPILQHVVATTNEGILEMQTNFIKYKDKKFAALKKFHNSQRHIGGQTIDFIFGAGDQYYIPLYNKRDFKVITGNETTEVNSIDFTLPIENTKEYNALTPDQQEMVTMFNDTISDAMESMGMDWTRGQIPLIKASPGNNLRKLAQNMKGSNVQGNKKIIDAFLSRFETFEDNYGYGEGTIDSSPRILQNSFFRQNEDTFRYERLGMDENQNSINPDLVGKYETNLEMIMDVVTINAMRMKSLKKASVVFNAAEAMFNMYRHKALFEGIVPNLDWLNAWRIPMLHNRDVDAGTKFNKFAKALNTVGALALIAYKPMSPAVAFLGQQLTFASQTLANQISKTGTHDSVDWHKAGVWLTNPKNWSLASHLLDNMGIVNMDATAWFNGLKRYGQSNLSVIRGGFLGFHAADWWSRGQSTIAQMMADGSLQQYSVKDGKLEYNQDIGDRYSGKEGKMLFNYMMDRAEAEGTLSEDGNRLTRAYDSKHIGKLKADMNSVIGGFDKETRALYNFYALGKMFGAFKSWVSSRFNRFYQKRYESKVQGDLVIEVDPLTGEDIYVWRAEPMEGVFQTMGLIWHNLTRAEKKGLHWNKMTKRQKNNTARAISDTVYIGTMISIMSMLSAALEGADDETKKKAEIYQLLLKRSLNDLMAMYDPRVVLGYATTPATVKGAQTLINDILNVISNDEEVSTVVKNVWSTQPFTDAFDQARQLMMINDSDDE